MIPEDEKLASLPVELADTRPDMIWLPWLGGIPTVAAALILAVFGELALAAKIWWMIFPAIGTWKVTAMLISRDFHATTLIQKYLSTSAYTLDSAAEGGAGPSTVPSAGPTGARRLLLSALRPFGLASKHANIARGM